MNRIDPWRSLMITAVLFDLFETLITESRIPPTRASSLGPALGLDAQAFRREWKVRRARVRLGQLSFAEALTEISTALTGGVDAAAVEKACEQRIREKARAFAEIDEDVATLIRDLRAIGLPLAVVSNCFAEDVRAWPEWPLAREFQCAVFSCTAGVAKPDPEIYLRAVHSLGVEAATTVFIGDDGDAELAGAEHAGLHAFRATWFLTRWPHGVASARAGVELANPHDVRTLVTAG